MLITASPTGLIWGMWVYYSRGYSIASLMEHFALSRNCVTNVVKNRTHRQVSSDPALPPLVRVEGAVQVLRPSNANRSKPAPELSDKYAKSRQP